MSEPRIVPPDEAQRLVQAATPGPWETNASEEIEARSATIAVVVNYTDQWSPNAPLIAAAPNLAHTAAVLGEQRAAVLALHEVDGDGFCSVCLNFDGFATVLFRYPCPTARALGVTE